MNSNRKFRGSAILYVIVFSTVMLVLIASLLRWGVTERFLNGRNQLRLESRNAAEALAEFGFSQIRQKFETRSTFNLNPAGTDALQSPATSFWTGGNVAVGTTELIGGTIDAIPSSGANYYVNPADQNNEFDPLKGKYVFRRDVRVIAKATASLPNRRSITSYVTERISVRGAPLFAHAIFYNMDLEVFPGRDMTISGPVHANGNLYIYPDDGVTLTFAGQVTATGNIFHAGKPGDAADGAGASGRDGNATFINKAGADIGLYNGSAWLDSTHGTGTAGTHWDPFRATASQTWNGNLQTGDHGVTVYKPVAIGEYVEDSTPSSGGDNSVNSGRTIIEPPNYPAVGDANYAQKMEVEQQKYANDAGLYLQVNPVTGAISAFSRSKSDPTKAVALTLPTSGDLVAFKPYKTSTYTGTAVTTTYSVGAKITSGPNINKYPVTPTTTTTVTPYTIATNSVGVNSTTASPASVTSVTGAVTYSNSSSVPSSSSSSSSTTPTTAAMTDGGGMYDNHRDKALDIVELDMDALRKAVTAMTGGTTVTLSTGSSAAVTAADSIGNLTVGDWTGIVYVEIVGGPTTSSTTGATTAAANANSLTTGVRIVNGQGRVPSYVGTNSSEGLTIATNAPVYIKGSFNADGSTTTSPVNSATAVETNETPAAIVGDAITILSKDFRESTSATANPVATTSTVEISAALLTGLTPSNKNGTGKSSGGAHNLPRFLENWGSKSVFIRGSLVALFESRIFTEPYDSSGYYSPPQRNWGFNDNFRAGRYPPGTPRVMSYRRVDFTDLTAAEYQTIKSSFSW